MNIWTKLAMFFFLKRALVFASFFFLVTVKRFSRLLQTLRIYSLFFPSQASLKRKSVRPC